MNHPLSPSSALLPVVRLVSHLSLLQRLLKVHQDVLLHKSLIALTVCTLAPSFHSLCFLRLSEREISVMLRDYTCKSDIQEKSRKKEEGRRRVRWRVTNPDIQNDKRGDMSNGSSVTSLFYRITHCFCTLWLSQSQAGVGHFSDWFTQTRWGFCIRSLIKRAPRRE